MAVSEFTIGREIFNRSSPARWIATHAVRHKWILLMAMLGAFGNAALASLVPVLVGRAFNAVLETPPQVQLVAQFALWIALSQMSRGLLQLARNFGFELIAQKVEREIRDELYSNLLGKSMTFHSRQPIGDTMARATNDVREVNFLFNPGLNMVVGSLNFLIFPIVVAPSYHPSLVITPIVFIVCYIIALRHYLRTLKPITDEVRVSFGILNTRLTEALDGIETVKGASQEVSEVARFGANARRYRDAVVKQGEVEARFLPLLLFSMALAFGLLHALLLNRAGLLDTGQVVAFFGLLLMLDFPTFASLWAYSQISSGLAGARRILEMLRREDNLNQNEQGYAGAMRGEIEFRNVSFEYLDGEAVVENVSFCVKPGQTVAIVGQTGSGKTTLIKLINRTYDVTRGQVLVDGIDVRAWNLEALRRKISIIEQDIFLFSRTIANNITFGKPHASKAEIEEVATQAQAHEFIESFSERYETIIGERGVTLSGGQRQRLALARAFLTDPVVLILDDSTSAIDSATEDRIQRAIYNAAKGRTTFIITHRLSQIRWADLIVVMRKGKVAAVGVHEELLQSSEAYRNIFSE
ncbi:MAG: ABC transporter ATP-binding protein [Anaerolineaceae bacterium]|jgi:ATP-binding cassette subfamily B protein